MFLKVFWISTFDSAKYDLHSRYNFWFRLVYFILILRTQYLGFMLVLKIKSYSNLSNIKNVNVPTHNLIYNL